MSRKQQNTRYIVSNGTIRHDGRTYEVGDLIELTEEQARLVIAHLERQVETPREDPPAGPGDPLFDTGGSAPGEADTGDPPVEGGEPAGE